MNGAEPSPLRRFELRWALAGVGWGVFLGACAGTLPMLVAMLSSGATPKLDNTWQLPLLWLVVLGTTGAMYGGIAGMIVGVVVMLAVGRDPEVQAARRTPATVALLAIPLVLLALLWST